MSKKPTAIWAVTPDGAELAFSISRKLPDGADVYASENLSLQKKPYQAFERIAEAAAICFHDYRHHIFIMAAGIVVRVIAPLLRDKITDPAVVVVDETGRFAVSLLSGHVGGANRFAERIAELIGAQPVITTATDSRQIPAIDVLATERNLVIENPSAIKCISMALLKNEPVYIYDPCGFLSDHRLNSNFIECTMPPDIAFGSHPPATGFNDRMPGVFIHDRVADLPDNWLLLRPKSLVAGVGCNRNTPMEEIKSLLVRTLEDTGLAYRSLDAIATIDIKKDEPGLISLSADAGLPILFFSKQRLNSVQNIAHPSAVVEKHTGAKSVCEAAAILAAENGNLVVSKKKTKNVTLAIARNACLSSVSDRETLSICPDGH
jgi:cobalt-precorrin 5A hydrolase